MQRTAILVLAGALSLQCLAQSNEKALPDKQPASAQVSEGALKKFYQLSFVVRELENEHVINSRSYSMILRGGSTERGSIRTGEEVPFTSTFGTSTQVQQIHVGVNIDCRNVEESNDQVALSTEAEISSVVDSHGDKSPPSSTPVIRTNRWQSTVLLPLKQPTVLFSSDDPASKRKMQLQLTVTPIR